MDQKIVLVQALSLLYWESLLDVAANDSSLLVKEVLNDLRLPEATLESDSSRDVLIGLRATILKLCDRAPTEPIDRGALLQRIRLNAKEDSGLYQAIAENLEESPDQSIIRKRVIYYSMELKNIQRQKQLKEKVKLMLSDIVYNANQTLDTRSVAMRVISELEPYVETKTEEGIKSLRGVVGVIDFEDAASIVETFEEAIKETSTEGILKTGYQCINRMYGWHAGFRRGDMIVVGALQHNYKSGFTTSLTKQIALYNKPYMLDPNKKPLILHISSENALTDNLLFLYSMLMENITGEACDTTNIDREAAAKWIQEQIGVNGYNLKMIRVNPTDFGYRDLFNMIMQFESDGYEIHLLTIDYLNMLSKEGCAMGPAGAEVRDLFRRVRNFCSARKITVLTPHQLSSQVKDHLRQGIDSIVKEVANKGYWDSCRVIDQEFDSGMIIHKVVIGDRSYLEIHRDKHRKTGTPTPEHDLYTVMPFRDIGGILDDINGVDTSMRKPGADLKSGSHGDGGDAAWFMPG